MSPGPIRWLVERLGSQHTASTMRLIHEFDKAMNDTSVILLIEAGTKRLLFGGDAQVYPHGRPVPAETPSRMPRLTLLEFAAGGPKSVLDHRSGGK